MDARPQASGETRNSRKAVIQKVNTNIRPDDGMDHIFGYLAEDDAIELNNINTNKKGGWMKITSVVDSGAGDNVMCKEAIPWIKTEPTEKSRAGRGFSGPGGEFIENQGQKKISICTAGGDNKATTWQIAPVKRPLMSVSKITDAGNAVYLRRKDPCIVNEKTGAKIKLRKEGNIYVVDMWVKVPPEYRMEVDQEGSDKKAAQQGPRSMDLDMAVPRSQSATSFRRHGA
jgi:hypothetical protein